MFIINVALVNFKLVLKMMIFKPFPFKSSFMVGLVVQMSAFKIQSEIYMCFCLLIMFKCGSDETLRVVCDYRFRLNLPLSRLRSLNREEIIRVICVVSSVCFNASEQHGKGILKCGE